MSMHFKTNISIEGPWLITKAELESLDKVVGEAFAKMRTHYDTRLATAIDEEFQARLQEHRLRRESKREAQKRSDKDATGASETKQSKREPKLHERLRKQAEEIVQGRASFKPPVREITIDVDGDRRLSGQTFADIAKQPIAISVTPTDVEISIKDPGVFTWCTLSISSYGTLSIRAYSENSAVAGDVFVGLRDWAVAAAAPKWQRKWISLHGLQWFLLIALGSVLVMLLEASSSTVQYTREAHALLASGITPQNQTRAIELILAMTSKYVPANAPAPAPLIKPMVALWIFGAAAVVSTCLSIAPPRFAIGLGATETAVDRWKRWIAFVKGTPYWIGSAIVAVKMKDLIGMLF